MKLRYCNGNIESVDRNIEFILDTLAIYIYEVLIGMYCLYMLQSSTKVVNSEGSTFVETGKILL